MGAVALWTSVVVASLMLVRPVTRNAGWFALVGSILGGFYHFDIADIPDVHDDALWLWAFALFLAAVRLFPRFGVVSARAADVALSFVFSLGPSGRAEV